MLATVVPTPATEDAMIPDEPRALRLRRPLAVHRDEALQHTLRPGTYVVAKVQIGEEMHARFCLLDDGRQMLGWLTAAEAGKAEKLGTLDWV